MKTELKKKKSERTIQSLSTFVILPTFMTNKNKYFKKQKPNEVALKGMGNLRYKDGLMIQKLFQCPWSLKNHQRLDYQLPE